MEDFTSEFLDEALELIGTYNDVCLKLESEGLSKPLMDLAFRAIHTIKGSGLSVGFVQMAEAAHKLEDELDLLRQSPPTTLTAAVVDRLIRWGDFLEVYLMGLKRDRAFVLDVRDLINSKPRPLFAPLEDATVEGDAIPLAEVASPETETETEPVPRTSQTKVVAEYPLFYRSYMVGPRAISEATAWSFMSLSVLSLPKTTTETFAAIALETLRSHCSMPDVTRVCLARRIGLSNQLEVISSASVGEENPLPAGNRCYVNPQSSLFNILPGTLRILDIQQTIDSFTSKGQAPQRAIKRLAGLGYRSGASVSLFCRGRLVGILFLNSDTDLFLRFPENQLPILSLLATHASTRLGECQAVESIYYSMYDSHSEMTHGHGLDESLLGTELTRATDLLGATEIALAGSANPAGTTAIVSHGNIAYLLAQISSHRGARSVSVEPKVSGETLHFDCHVSGDLDLILDDRRLEAGAMRAKALGFEQTRIANDAIRYSTTIDRNWQPKLRYST